jgi:hypothetical protein
VTTNDALLCTPFVLSVPLLVRHYFPQPRFSQGFLALVIFGGLLWIWYAAFSDVLAELILGVTPDDALGHERFAEQFANYMCLDRWDLIWEDIRVGNPAYHFYMACVFLVTGASPTTMYVSNGWFAFWGSLALASHLGNVTPEARDRWGWLLAIIFYPSVIFWSTQNLKEGLMYWAICMAFTGTMAGKNSSGAVRVPFTVAGIAVGGILRPHMMVAWLSAVLTTNLLRARRFGYSLIIVMTLILSMIGTKNKLGLGSPEEALEYQANISKAMLTAHRASDIDFGPGGPTLFFSGANSVFFRPPPIATSLRMLLSGWETWGTTLLIFLVWLKMNGREKRLAIKSPEIQAAAIAVVLFCFLLSYIPNTGLLVRQRLQAVPALITLAVWPIFRFGLLRLGSSVDSRIEVKDL